MEAELLADHPAIAEKLAVIDVPDGNIMLHYVNERLLDALPSGWYGYCQGNRVVDSICTGKIQTNHYFIIS